MNQTSSPDKMLAPQPVLDLNNPADKLPWVALLLFSMRQQEIKEQLESEGLSVYVPLQWVDMPRESGHPKRVLKPVVRNLLFVKVTKDVRELSKIFTNLPYPVRLIRYSPKDSRPAMIPASQMYEFQVMCNPDFMMKKYISNDEAKLKKGSLVKVTHGPLKGLCGRLVRANKHYFLLKEVPGIAIMLNVSRWCCVPVEEEETQPAVSDENQKKAET